MEKQRIIIGPERFSLTIERLCHQLVEEFDDFSNTCIIGIQPRGVALSERIYRHLIDQLNIPPSTATIFAAPEHPCTPV